MDANLEISELVRINKENGLSLNQGLNTNIGAQIAAIECKQVESDVFIVNDATIPVPGSNDPITLLGPWCVNSG